jgi:hypothetical protein
MAKHQIEIYVAMNEDGDFRASDDYDAAVDNLSEDCGGYMRRVVKLTVSMSAPKMDEASVLVADSAGETIRVTEGP